MLTQMCLRTSKNSKQVNMLLYGHRNRKFFLGTGKAGGGGGGGEVSCSSAQSDPERSRRPWTTARRTTM